MKFGRFSLSLRTCATALLLLGVLSSQTIGQERPILAGRVVDIDGPRLYTNKLKAGSWFQAYTGMNAYVTERLRTDKETQAVISFTAGGRAGIGRNSQVELISGRKAEKVIASGMRIDAGNFWAKFDKQEEELKIYTSGGVIGIEGTELLVGVDPDTGVTEVLLFEGQISVTDEKGNKKTMFPGDYAEFGGSKGMCVLSYPPASLRTLIVERYPKFSSFLATQNITSIPKPASPTLIRGNNKARTNILAALDASQQKTGSAPQGLSPSQTKVSGGAPSFRWSPVPGADSYALFVSGDQAGQEMMFSSRVEGESFTMPEGAQGLGEGRYYWSVVGLDGDGNPVGQSSQTWFETPGWTTTGVSLDS